MKYLKLFENFNNLVLYHGSRIKFENLQVSAGLEGLYTSVDIKVAEDYGPFIFKITSSKNIRIKDLSYPFELLNYLVENIIDKENIDTDLENYILSGRLFQYEISSNTHYMDYLVKDLRNQGYDLIKVPDDLGGKGDNIAYIITKLDNFNYKLWEN